MAQDFHDQLIQFLPKMRVWALALTRNRAAAEDLTQDVATKALVAQDCFTPGTNFSAWVHRIMVNHFISGVRSRREYTDVDTMPEMPVPAAHEDRTALRELGWALERLPRDQREALQMIVLQEQSYEDACRGHRLRDRHIEEPRASRPIAVARLSHRRAGGGRGVIQAAEALTLPSSPRKWPRLGLRFRGDDAMKPTADRPLYGPRRGSSRCNENNRAGSVHSSALCHPACSANAANRSGAYL